MSRRLARGEPEYNLLLESSVETSALEGESMREGFPACGAVANQIYSLVRNLVPLGGGSWSTEGEMGALASFFGPPARIFTDAERAEAAAEQQLLLALRTAGVLGMREAPEGLDLDGDRDALPLPVRLASISSCLYVQERKLTRARDERPSWRSQGPKRWRRCSAGRQRSPRLAIGHSGHGKRSNQRRTRDGCGRICVSARSTRGKTAFAMDRRHPQQTGSLRLT